ncbi:Flp family type IVb pilin [Marimonas arenosa]|uniref:Pilus assembly protein Flp/PilA n=1 Tax=Marimonas arenosa TaxID=1795305 RepID=A0AAE3WDK4_9RHOB|nr:hypothetical protein [Marimonas arenosa]MDQ2089683.1 hypothetical protein [Marimonas arenosa]
MKPLLADMLFRLCRDERGVTLVEYGIAITLAVTVGAAGFVALGGEIGVATVAAGAEMPN